MATQPDRETTATHSSVVLDDTEFAVLNAIHLKKLVDTARLSELLEVTPERLSEVLERGQSSAWLMSMDSGHMLLPDGTAAVHNFYALVYADVRAEPAVQDWYARFETLNKRFIAALTTWQQLSAENELFKALEIVEELNTALNALLPRVPRYADYRRRFAGAIEAIDEGDTDLLCNPRRDSAHNIWFEFHEDILSVLGRPRDTT